MRKKKLAVILGLLIACSLSSIASVGAASQKNVMNDLEIDLDNPWESLIIDKILNGEDETAALWKRLLELKRSYRKLENEKDELEKSIGLIQAEEEGLEERVAELEGKGASTTENASESSEDFDRITELEVEIEAYREQIKALEDRLSESELKESAAEEEKVKNLEKIKVLEEENAENLERIKALEEENAKNLERINDLEEENAKNLETIRAYEVEKIQSETEVTEEQTEIQEAEVEEKEESVLAEPVLNDNPEAVKKAQLMLSMLGYRCGPLDGKLGTNTKIALHDYKTQKGMDDATDITESILKEMRADLYPDERDKIMQSDFLKMY